METVKNYVENEKLEENSHPMEQQIFDYDDVDRKEFDFDAHFNGDVVGSGDEFDDDKSFENR